MRNLRTEIQQAREDIKRMRVEDLVKAGMAWLDANIPGHVERFDAERFDIYNRYDYDMGWERTCVLIQAAELPWDQALTRYDLTYTDAVNLGFQPVLGDATFYNEVWIQAYAARETCTSLSCQGPWYRDHPKTECR